MGDIDIRFEEAPEDAYEVLTKMRRNHFPELVNANILILMDTKKRTADSGNKIVMGRIEKTNDLTRHLTIDDAESERGFDYIMYLDKMMWSMIDRHDKDRTVRHELRHTMISEADMPYKLRAHTIEDFYSEVSLNEDDPRWRERVGIALSSRYDQLKRPKSSDNPQNQITMNDVIGGALKK